MKMDVKEAFGQVIRELRDKQGLSQQELADYSEVDRTFISGLERGVNSPTLQTIYKLAEVLKLKPSELIQKVDKLTLK